jgi:hypothetical protein
MAQPTRFCQPLQSVDTRKKAINAPVRIKPHTPARRSLLVITPIRLKMNPRGVARSIVSPPRAEMGDPQPGRNSVMTASAANGASEKQRPIRHRPILRSGSGSAWMIGGSAIIRRSELHLYGLACGRQRLEVELDVDGDFLAGHVLWYSP